MMMELSRNKDPWQRFVTDMIRKLELLNKKSPLILLANAKTDRPIQ